MIARVAAIAIAATVMMAPAIARAEPLDLGPATLALDDGWTGAAPAPEGVTRSRGAVTVVVRRWEVPNLPAWRSATRDEHLDAIARGFATAPGYVELTRTATRTGRAGVPTLDVTFRRRGAHGDEVVAARVLCFRTLTMVAIAGGAERATVERVTRALTPD